MPKELSKMLAAVSLMTALSGCIGVGNENILSSPTPVQPCDPSHDYTRINPDGTFTPCSTKKSIICSDNQPTTVVLANDKYIQRPNEPTMALKAGDSLSIPANNCVVFSKK